jgi:hypothetical protein
MTKSDLLPVLNVALRILTFRATKAELLGLDHRHLAFGLFCTWVVGMGRSWDDTDASLLQHLGVGSVVYVFALSFLLWATLNPLAPVKVSYPQALAFVSLVAPPALLYAIPVEQFVVPEIARTLNVLLLCVVASWRVALLVFYLTRGVQLRPAEIFVVTLFPLSTILAPITVFGLLNAIASAMGGLRDGQELSEPATQALYLIGSIAIVAWLPLAIANSILIAHRRRRSD